MSMMVCAIFLVFFLCVNFNFFLVVATLLHFVFLFWCKSKNHCLLFQVTMISRIAVYVCWQIFFFLKVTCNSLVALDEILAAEGGVVVRKKVAHSLLKRWNFPLESLYNYFNSLFLCLLQLSRFISFFNTY